MHKHLQKHDFVRALRIGKQIKAQTMRVFSQENPYGFARLGIIVDKKVAPRAVDRNRAKRILRELFRSLRTQLAAHDIIIRVRGTYDSTFEIRLKQDAKNCLLRISQ